MNYKYIFSLAILVTLISVENVSAGRPYRDNFEYMVDLSVHAVRASIFPFLMGFGARSINNSEKVAIGGGMAGVLFNVWAGELDLKMGTEFLLKGTGSVAGWVAGLVISDRLQNLR